MPTVILVTDFFHIISPEKSSMLNILMNLKKIRRWVTIEKSILIIYRKISSHLIINSGWCLTTAHKMMKKIILDGENLIFDEFLDTNVISKTT